MGVFGIDIDETKGSADAEIPTEIKEICDAIGVEATGSLDDALSAIIEVRANARANKDWCTADKIRDSIAAAGWTMEDTAQGTKIYR